MARQVRSKPIAKFSKTPAKRPPTKKTLVVRPRIGSFPKEKSIPRTPSLKALESSPVISQSFAVTNFPAICGDVVKMEAKVFVMDRQGKVYLTLDPFKNTNVRGPVIDVTAQQFRDQFSAFSSLIKVGMCFRVKSRRSDVAIYARQHSSYRHPLKGLIDEWRERIPAASVSKAAEDRLLNAIKAAGRPANEEILEAIRLLKVGIARISIGHRPFEEGELPKGD